MTAEQIDKLVRSQIGDAWDTTNAHGVDLRKALVRPKRIKVIQQWVHNGRIRDQLIDGWLVLVEEPPTNSGYRIVASADGSTFGLASAESESDEDLMLCGWYGDFMTAFQCM